MQQVAEVPDAGFEQVAEAVGAVAEQLYGVGGVGVLGQDDDADLRVVLPDRVGRVDSFDLVAGGHPDVGEDRVGPELPDRGEQFVAVADAGEHVDLAGVLQQPAGALADEVVVLGDHDPQPVSHELVLRRAATR